MPVPSEAADLVDLSEFFEEPENLATVAKAILPRGDLNYSELVADAEGKVDLQSSESEGKMTRSTTIFCAIL